MNEEEPENFPTQGKQQITKEVFIAIRRTRKAKDHEKEKKEETKGQNNKRSKQCQKARFLATIQHVKHKRTYTHGYTESTRDHTNRH